MNNAAIQSIGIFDSGVGGLTVMKALQALLPHENIIYLGDTARLPYGNKSPDTIQRYSMESCLLLKNMDVKLLIIACHTAAAIALPYLQQQIPIPIIGINEQAIDIIKLHCTQPSTLAILGTKATISSQFYQRTLQQELPQTQLFPIACPLFVPLIEEGYISHPLTQLAVEETLHPIKSLSLDALLLACTHYPLIDTLIRQALHCQPLLIDPAMACAQKAAELLCKGGLLNLQPHAPSYRFYVSDDPEKFRHHANLFLSHPIEDLSLISVGDPILTC